MLTYLFSVWIVQKGNGFNLLKINSKRRRTKGEIQQEKEEQILKEEAIQQKLDAYEAMQQRLTVLETQANNNAAATNILNAMIDRGEAVQDDQGNI